MHLTDIVRLSRVIYLYQDLSLLGHVESPIIVNSPPFSGSLDFIRQVSLLWLSATISMGHAATSLTLVVQLSLFRNDLQNVNPPTWFFPMGVASFSLSLTVNTIVTGLLVLKLVLLHREIRRSLPDSSTHKGYDLLPVISVLIESGMFTFIGQLVWVVLFRLQSPGFNAVGSPITMIYVSPRQRNNDTIILFWYNWPWIGYHTDHHHCTSVKEKFLRLHPACETREHFALHDKRTPCGKYYNHILKCRP